MSQEDNKAILQKELNLLNALGRVANTADGKMVIAFILQESHINEDPYLTSNSGEMCKKLGRQAVGRSLVDKLIESGSTVSGDMFSRKSILRISIINKELEKFNKS